jgi:acyl carrier protein
MVAATSPSGAGVFGTPGTLHVWRTSAGYPRRVNDEADVAAVVLDILAMTCPGRVSGVDLRDETHLGSTGLGLDSIEIVEVLLGCEEHYGTPVEMLLDGAPLTLGRVVKHFAPR